MCLEGVSETHSQERGGSRQVARRGNGPRTAPCRPLPSYLLGNPNLLFSSSVPYLERSVAHDADRVPCRVARSPEVQELEGQGLAARELDQPAKRVEPAGVLPREVLGLAREDRVGR